MSIKTSIKKGFLAAALVALMSLVVAPFALAAFADDIGVTIDGEAVVFTDQAPVIVDGSTLVPVRGVFEHLGFYVEWDGETRQVTLTSDDFVVVLTIDSADFTTNGATHTLDVPAQIIGGSTMLPLRAVLESVGYGIDWDGAARIVLISSPAVAPTAPTPQVEEPEPTPTPVVAAGLAGEWVWVDLLPFVDEPYYILNANGTGYMGGEAFGLQMEILWGASGGIFSVCTTPDLCGTISNCPAPLDWYYELDGNALTLTSTTIPGMYYEYVRR